MSWIKEFICGLILTLIGLVLIYKFWYYFISVIKGVIGAIIIIIGILFIGVSLEDRKTEKLFNELEKEEKEEVKKEE